MGTFLSRLRYLIKTLAGDKHTVFAKHAGIPTSTFQNYIKGRVPHLDHILRIRETYNVNIDWLLTGEGNIFVSDSNNDVGSDKIIELEFIDVVKGFKNKHTAKEFNEILKRIEKIDERKFFEALGYIKNELKNIEHSIRLYDRRSGVDRRKEDTSELAPEDDRRSGIERRVAGLKS